MNWPPADEPAPPGDKINSELRSAQKIGDLHKAITMAQIAKAAGVSQGAISSLLNDRDYGIRVSEKTRERVFKVCREMGYIPNDLRAVVRMYPELGEYCFLIATSVEGGLSDPFVARMARAAMMAVNEESRPLTLALYDPLKDYSGNSEELPYPVRSGVASKFLFHGPMNQSVIQHIIRRGLPVVSLGTDIPTTGVISMVPDFVAASRLAIEHLYELGHRQIGIVSGPFGATESHIIELHHGVRMACAELKLPLDAQNIVYGDLGYSSGVAAVEELLSHSVKPTAVFCLSDAAAAGAIAKAHTRGFSVPDDLSVVGCSDDFCAQIILPALTTVHVPAEEMADFGVREIERLVREPMPMEPRRHMVPVRLEVRGSTGPVKR
jgi:LacI family transcriptional regulator